jgi:transcriptional regulator GlxA family with amidase domain
VRQQVVVVVPEGGSLFEIATPLRVWGVDPGEPEWPPIDLVACDAGDRPSPGSGPSRGGGSRVGLAVPPLVLGGLAPLAEHARRADMIVVPTWAVGAVPVPATLTDELRAAHARGCRIVGLCLGAFAVVETGLLDGRGAVTHWRYADDFARRFPEVRVDRAPLYLDEGSVVTSAGSAAALDCCLHLVRRDHGADAAAVVARSLVTAPHRAGGQSQFAVARPLGTADDQLGRLLSAAAEDLVRVRDVGDLVTRAGMSRRALERLFRHRLGTSPGDWLADQRVQAARRLLEGTDRCVEDVADAVGFGSVQALRREFKSALRLAPTAYRRAFRAPTTDRLPPR